MKMDGVPEGVWGSKTADRTHSLAFWGVADRNVFRTRENWSKTCNCRKNDQVGPQGELWEGQGGPGKCQGAPGGPKVKIRKRQEDPEGSPGAKFVKNVVRYAPLKGSREGSGEAQVRIALTLKRFGGYRGKSMKNQLFFNDFEGPREGQGGAQGAGESWAPPKTLQSECDPAREC